MLIDSLTRGYSELLRTYEHYSPEASPARYAAAETAACVSRLGPWQDPEPHPLVAGRFSGPESKYMSRDFFLDELYDIMTAQE